MKIRTSFASMAFILLAALGASTALAGPSLEELAHAEVVELHQSLEEWFNAELPMTDEAFARFADVIDPSFLIIGPDGEVTGREAILEAIRAGYGRWREAPGKIRIENFRLRHTRGGLVLAMYEEWHELEEESARLSSVLFGMDKNGPNRLVWLHLHEVWIGLDPEGY